MKTRAFRVRLATALAAVCAAAVWGASAPPSSGGVATRQSSPESEEPSPRTRVIMLGTGTPIADPSRAGASVAVVHHGEAYLFDLGAGAVRRAVEARFAYDIPSLYPSAICCVFFTHLHSDHIVDLPELVETLWWRRTSRLRAFGPEGLQRTIEGVYQTFAIDTGYRLAGPQPIANPDFHAIDVTEIGEGLVFEAEGMTIEAFAVAHGKIEPAYGYRIDTEDKSIVISGDTAFSETLVQKATGVDLLIHEVISEVGLSRLSEAWQEYHNSSHSTTRVVGEVGRRARPKRIVLYHALFYGEDEASLVDEVRTHYDGDVVLADDLDVF